jgi:hypothetical protein
MRGDWSAANQVFAVRKKFPRKGFDDGALHAATPDEGSGMVRRCLEKTQCSSFSSSAS